MTRTIEVPDGRDSNIPPGTVSKILWHFTGGPQGRSGVEWGMDKDIKKPPKVAFENLISILRSKEIRTGSVPEEIRYPSSRIFLEAGGINYPAQEVKATLPACCLADIPISHLNYHCGKYGKIAIGFHRMSVLKAGFHPVFYTLEHGQFATMLGVAHEAINFLIEYLDGKGVISFEKLIGLKPGPEKFEIDEKVRASARNHFEDVANFIQAMASATKTFDVRQFHDIYCEREWRSFRPFPFDISRDVAMIVLPKTAKDDVDYYKLFIEHHAESLDVPRQVPIVAWEDLVEH